MIDKNKATLNFIATYPEMATSPIFMNFINATNDDVQFLTSGNDKDLNKEFVDGSVMKQYIFSIVITKTIASMALAKEGANGENTIDGENIDDMAEVQAFMDWINKQGKDQNYPDFGSDCVIEEMHTTAENPSIDGINTETGPALALYSVEIRIVYIDYSDVIWS